MFSSKFLPCTYMQCVNLVLLQSLQKGRLRMANVSYKTDGWQRAPSRPASGDTRNSDGRRIKCCCLAPQRAHYTARPPSVDVRRSWSDVDEAYRAVSSSQCPLSLTLSNNHISLPSFVRHVSHPTLTRRRQGNVTATLYQTLQLW